MNTGLLIWRKNAKLSQTQAAAAFGISQAAVSNIERGIARAGATLAITIEKITSGAVTKEQIRPDIFAPSDHKEGE